MRMRTMENGLIEVTIKEQGLKFYTDNRNDAITIAWKMGKNESITGRGERQKSPISIKGEAW